MALKKVKQGGQTSRLKNAARRMVFWRRKKKQVSLRGDKRIPLGFKKIHQKLATYVRNSNRGMLYDGHLFNTITGFYRKLIGRNKRLLDSLARDLFDSKLVKRMNKDLERLKAEPLTEKEVKKILTGKYMVAMGIPADPVLIAKRLEEAAKRHPGIKEDAVQMLASLQKYKTMVNAGEPFCTDTLIMTIEFAYQFGGSRVESATRKGPWRFDKEFLADLMLVNLKPTNFLYAKTKKSRKQRK